MACGMSEICWDEGIEPKSENCEAKLKELVTDSSDKVIELVGSDEYKEALRKVKESEYAIRRLKRVEEFKKKVARMMYHRV